MLEPFRDEMVSLLISSLESSNTRIVKAAASVLFNLLRILLDGDMQPGDDEFICIAVAVVQSLNVSLQNEEDSDFIKLLIVCLGGIIVICKDFSELGQLLIAIEASETVSKVSGVEAQEILRLLNDG